ncbi:MAG: DUF4124 domain-containing protein [Granulosicoccus sp.]
MKYGPLESKIVAEMTMLWRLVAKLSFKAMVPLIAVAGVFTYGVYMRGGDPAAMWKSIASGSVERAVAVFSGVQNDASRAVGTLSSAASAENGSGKLERTQVFTWQDADGVTHYSTSAPEHVSAQTMTVNPNVNVVAPVRAPVIARRDTNERGSGQSSGEDESFQPAGNSDNTEASSRQRRSGRQSDQSKADSEAIAEVKKELGGTLPGVAGQFRSGESDSGGGSGIDPSQLMRMLQSSGN